MIQLSLTIYFAESLWVGVVEEHDGGDLRVARQIFGAEPGPGEVLAFVLRDMLPLLERAGDQPVEAAPAPRALNPKRAAREAARASAARGVSTQAQEAMRLEIERHKVEHQEETKQERETASAQRRALAVARRKERHRGH
jgi:hypothetical protein